MPEDFELAVERLIAAPPETVWRAWTEHLTEWWCPKPWTTRIIEQDLRSGGITHLEMHGPNGESHAQQGVFLEVVPARRVVFTDAFRQGWHPQKAFMVGLFEFTAEGSGTRYRASARHWDEASMQQHRAMGFEAGWGAVADQLAAVAEALDR